MVILLRSIVTFLKIHKKISIRFLSSIVINTRNGNDNKDKEDNNEQDILGGSVKEFGGVPRKKWYNYS